MDPDIDINPTNQLNHTEINVKTPKRILHFSDGTMDEFTSDDDAEIDENDHNNNTNNENCDNGKTSMENTIDVSKMTWGPWILYKATKTGNTFLAGCDYLGESIVSFLGITTPKYSYEIEAFKKIQAEQEQQRKEDEEATWIKSADDLPSQQKIDAIVVSEKQLNTKNTVE